MTLSAHDLTSRRSLAFAPPASVNVTPATELQASEGEAGESGWQAILANTPRAKGDSELARRYGELLLGCLPTRTPNNDTLELPVDSTFGQWWAHLGDILKSPSFVSWASRNKLDVSKSFSIVPSQGVIHGIVAGERRSLILKRDADLSKVHGLLMNAVKVLAAGSPSLAGPHDGMNALVADVAHFYGEAIPDTLDAANARAQALKTRNAFVVTPGLDPARFAGQRSDTVLELRKTALGDLHDQHALAKKLQSFPSNGSRQLDEYLKNTTLEIHPDSSWRALNPVPGGGTSSLAHFIEHNEWYLPKDRDELANLIRVMTAAPLPEPHHGNLGGALSWDVALSQDDQKLVYSHVIHGNLATLDLHKHESLLRRQGALGYLAAKHEFSANDLRNPRNVIERIIHGNAAERLGNALQAKMGALSTRDSAQDWVLTAIATTLDSESVFRPKRNHVAGFDLAHARFSGKTVGSIKQGLIEHLSTTGKATAQMAPIAAYLLLSRVAPELLVSNVPDNVTYGSVAWATLKAAVARIEAQSPGAAAQMSFIDVVLRDANEPIGKDEDELQRQTGLPVLVEWGQVNGTLPQKPSGVYTAAEVERTRTALSEKVAAQRKAHQQLDTPLPTQRSIALEELKKAFGETMPFELKCITSTQSIRAVHARDRSATSDVHFRSYSLLDLYLSGRASEPTGWRSESVNVPLDYILPTLINLDPPKPIHEKAFADYRSGIESAFVTQTKNLISKLPLEDRRNLEYGKLTVYVEGEVTRSITPVPNGIITHEGPVKQPLNAQTLLVRTEHADKQAFYEISPQQGYVFRRDDLGSNFSEGVQGEWIEKSGPIGTQHTNTAVQQVKPTDAQDAALRAANAGLPGAPPSFTSPRSQYIGELASRHACKAFQFDEALEASKAVTTFDEEEATRRMVREIFLGLAPLGSAVRHLINGDYEKAVSDVLFDGIMYVTSMGIGKGAGAANGAAKATRPFGKALLNAAAMGKPAPLSTLHNAVQDAAHSMSGTLGKLRPGTTRKVDLLELAKRPDIAEGTFRLANNVESLRIPAQLDGASGKWFAFDANRKVAYGPALDNFKPSSSTWIDDALPGAAQKASISSRNLIDAGLEVDNVIQMGGPMKDLKLIDNEIHAFVDTYKGVDRLNVVAHGLERGWVDKMLGNGSSIVINNKAHSPKELVAMLKGNGLDPSAYDNVRLLVCHSAEGKSKSFGRLLQQEIKKPVKAFEGTVSVKHGSTLMTTSRDDLVRQINNLGLASNPQKAMSLANAKMQRDFVGKVTQYVEKAHGQTIQINVADVGQAPRYVPSVVSYRPVVFNR